MSKDLNKWLDDLEREFLSQTRDDTLIEFGESIIKSAFGEYGNIPFGGSAIQRLMGADGKTIPELTKNESSALNALDSYCSVYTGFALIHGTDEDRKNYRGGPGSPERAAWHEYLKEIRCRLLDEIGLVGDLSISVDGEIWNPR